jgi:F-type H+-transporting ATPase subunit b
MKLFLFRSRWWLGLIALGILICSTLAFGEEGAAESHASGIPRIVFYQALNFFGLIAILFYLMRNKVQAFFLKRHEVLTAALTEARRVREEAEKKHQEYTIKIQNLENESGNLIAQIRKEGEEAKNRLISEAKVLAETIHKEAKRTAENEIEKAKADLYDEVLQQSLEGARRLLETSIVTNDQKRLQREFVEKVEAVQ